MEAVNYEKLTWQERRRIRLEYIEHQKGLCFFCKEKLSDNPAENIAEMEINRKLFPQNFFNYPVHLQHNHKTGLTEGAVHAYCNAVLWQYYGR